MKKKDRFTLVLLLGFVCSCFSQTPKIIDTLKIHAQIKEYGLDEKVINFTSNFFESIVFKNDSVIYYNPDGTLHLFKIQLGDSLAVSKLSNSIHSGHNFERNLFLHNETLYSFGGHGLFNNFSGIIYFDPALKGWLETKIKNYPIDSERVINSWKHGDSLMVLLSHIDDSGSDSKSNIKYSFGEINLNDFTYQEHFNYWDGSYKLIYKEGKDDFRGDYVYDSQLYSLYGYYRKNGVCEYRIFEKSSGTLRRTSKLDAITRVDGISYVYVKGDTIYYRDKHGDISSFNVDSDTVIESINYLEKYKAKVGYSQKEVAIILIAIVILLIAIMLIRKQKIKSNQTTKELANIEKVFVSIKSTTITKGELDNLLGISHYSYETIKTKRSSILNQLNQNGKVKIERVRKQSDKRFYNYKIS